MGVLQHNHFAGFLFITSSQMYLLFLSHLVLY